MSNIMQGENTEGKFLDKVKSLAIKKKYKEGKKNHQAIVISKENFLALCAENQSQGLTDAVIASIEPVVALTPRSTDFYQVKHLEAIINQVSNAHHTFERAKNTNY